MCQTCKLIEQCTMQRIVWIDALHRMMEVNRIFKPTFKVDDMSQRQLEHATLAPFLFSSRITKETGSAIEPYIIQKVSHVLSKKEQAKYCIETLESFDSAYLVPGGRFLLTVTTLPTSEESSLVQLWDLGVPSEGIGRTRVSSMKIVGHAFYMLALNITPEGNGLRLFSHLSLSKEVETITVQEIILESPEPKFQSIATMKLPGTNIRTDVHGNLLAAKFDSVQCEPAVVVWDFVHDLAVSWKCGNSFSWDSMIHLYNGFLVISKPRTFLAWGVPSLLPRELKPEHWRFIWWPPLVEEEHTGPGKYHTLSISDSHWDSNANPRSLIMMNIRGSGLNGAPFLDVYKMRQMDGNSQRLANLLTPLEGFQTDITHSIKHALYPCDDRLCFCYCRGDGRVSVCTFPVPDNIGHISQITRAVLSTDTDGQLTSEDLCAGSGRLCIIEMKELRVLDYLPPP
ncbi:hypothetical protein B0H34DRAFT_715263 [Crassisporium funariophilum]|nr:hypothetical protein B0H34DRAFT_715263 [Crassisporium funariophilum]